MNVWGGERLGGERLTIVPESRNKAGVELKKMYLNAVIGLPSLFSLFCVIYTQEDDKQKHATFPDVFVHYVSIYFTFM